MENYKTFIQSLYSLGNVDYSCLLNNCTMGEFIVLSKIDICMTDEKLEFVNVSKLAEKLNVSMPAVSRILKSLETKKFIERNVDIFCRRNTRVKITKKGKIEAGKCQKNIDDFFAQVFSDLNENEQKMMANSFQIMSQRMHEKMKEYKGEE